MCSFFNSSVIAILKFKPSPLLRLPFKQHGLQFIMTDGIPLAVNAKKKKEHRVFPLRVRAMLSKINDLNGITRVMHRYRLGTQSSLYPEFHPI